METKISPILTANDTRPWTDRKENHWFSGAVRLLVAAALGVASPVHAQEPLAAYPYLDEKELGAVNNIVDLAMQPGFENMEPGPRGAFDQYQFQLAWMYYALALAQTQQTPAYRELYQDTSDRLIQKMLQPEVWTFWLDVLKDPAFQKYIDPKVDLRDPVKQKNIMYSGHLLQMVGLYQRLYGDAKYNRMGAISFAMEGENGFHNDYSFVSLARNIRQQFIENELAGIECEPNLVFAECNQHPILGLMDYDKLYGTNLADLRGAFWDEAEKLGLFNHETSRYAGPHMKAEHTTGQLKSAWNDGWTGVTMHAWNRDEVAAVYPIQRDAELARLVDQAPDVWLERWSKAGVSTDFGFLAAYAAELGDTQTQETLLRYADEHLKPQQEDGRYFYPRQDVRAGGAPMRITGQEVASLFSREPDVRLLPEQLGDHLVGPLTGNALLAFARLNPGSGLWKLYNDLASTYRADAPELVSVDRKQIAVSQAY